VHIKVLGPIEVTEEGREIRLAGQRQRALLAALVLDLGRTVPVSRLVDVLWGGSPPPTARAKVQAHVSAIRQAIGHPGRTADEPLLTCPPGYVLGPQGVDLDLVRFEELTTRAYVASGSGDPAVASGHFAAALGLWRGPAFADVASPLIRAAAAVLEERRLLAVEAKAAADLALGRCETVSIT
jgi:DNA-binding SARP family transcriptional activator